MGKFAQLVPYLKTIQINFRHPTQNRTIGLEQSILKGVSEEPLDSRPYQRGDDIRHINWRLYARTDRYFVKEGYSYARRNIEIFIDFTPSVLAIEKVFETSLLLSLSLYYLLWRAKNKTVLRFLTFNQSESFGPKNESEIIYLEDYLTQKYYLKKPKQKFRMDFLNEPLPLRKQVIFISDLYFPLPMWESFLIKIKSQKIPFSVFHVFQIPEYIPKSYFSVLSDSETGEWTTSRLFTDMREIWEKAVSKRYHMAQSLGIPVFPIPCEESILRFLDQLGYL